MDGIKFSLFRTPEPFLDSALKAHTHTHTLQKKKTLTLAFNGCLHFGQARSKGQ